MDVIVIFEASGSVAYELRTKTTDTPPPPPSWTALVNPIDAAIFIHTCISVIDPGPADCMGWALFFKFVVINLG